MTCGPEVGKVVQTFLLINVPLLIFFGLTGPYLQEYFQRNQPQSVYSIINLVILYICFALLPIINILLMMTASTDPGIIPARSWQNCK